MAPRPRTTLHVQPLEDRTTPAYLDGQALLAFHPGSEQTGLAAVTGTPGVLEAKEVGFGVYRVKFQTSVSVPTAVSTLSALPGVQFAEPNYQIYKKATPNDPSFTDGTLWAQRNTGQNGGTAGADTRAVGGWDVGTGTGTTIVAILDDGIQYTHPDLTANMWRNEGEVAGDGLDNDGNGQVDDIHGYDFTRDTGDILGGINSDHGTHVAGTVGAVGNNGAGVTGMAWKTRLMSVPIFSSGAGNGLADAISALNYAVRMGSKLSNNSWGYQGPSSPGLLMAIAAANAQGHVFVTAAGNTSDDNDVVDDFPTNYYGTVPNVVSVSAFDRNDQMAGFSSYGRRKVMLGAPGVDITSTVLGGAYGVKQGTSMASPQVAGALAVFMDATPGASVAEVMSALRQSVRRVPAANNKTDTDGVLDLNALMQLSGAATYATGAGEGGGPHVKVYRGDGNLFRQFMAYDARFTGGVRVSTGDVTGDRQTDVVTVPGPGGGPHVKVFDGRTGAEVFSFFAFEPTFRGGLTVATGDVNGDGRADVIVGAEAGGGPRVAVFSKLTPTGGLTRIADFFAYAPAFTGGVRVSAGVFTAGGKAADVLTAPGAGGGPHLKRFAAATLSNRNPSVVMQTMVGDVNDRSGLWIAAGDLTGDGVADIAAGVGSGSTTVNVLDGRSMAPIQTLRNPNSGELPGLTNPGSSTQVGSSAPPPTNNGLTAPGTNPDSLPFTGNPAAPGGPRYGVRVAIHDVDGDKKPDLILAGGRFDSPTISLIDGQTYTPLSSYLAYDPAFFGGVYVGGVGA